MTRIRRFAKNRLSLCCRCMVVHDLPSVREPAKHERKQAMRSFPVGHGQMPLAANKRRVGPECRDAHIGKLQLAHFVAWTLIVRLVSIHGLLPAMPLIR